MHLLGGLAFVTPPAPTQNNTRMTSPFFCVPKMTIISNCIVAKKDHVFLTLQNSVLSVLFGGTNQQYNSYLKYEFMAHNVATNGSPRFTQNTDVVLVSYIHICKFYITFFADT